MAKKRDYASEYKNYQGSPTQLKNRASRNKARADMMKAGKAHKGDGLDVEHISGNPKNNKMTNLKMGTKHANRSYERTKTARKKNPRD